MKKLKHMKILGKMIDCEDIDTECRELTENEIDYLMSEGFIEEERWGHSAALGRADFSTHKVTDLGRETYFSWMEGH